VLDVDFSDEYDRAQIDKMEDELKDDNKFATDQFVSAIIRREADNSSPSARAAAARRLMQPGSRRETIERAYELKKNGFDKRDFVLDRMYALFLNEQKKAAEAVKESIKNQATRQQRVSELTGLDIDVSRIKGIENTIDEIVEGYTKRIDSLLGNDKREKKVSLDDVFGD
jgi:SOS response regulatory protein OraA/RecX